MKQTLRTSLAAHLKGHHHGHGGGGGGWWDATSKIDIDLVNNRAWTESGGEVAIDTLLGSDANTDGWASTAYDPNLLGASGLACGDASPQFPAFIGLARSSVLAGATVRFRWLRSFPGQLISLVLFAANGGDAVEIDGRANKSAKGQSFNGNLNLNILDILQETDGQLIANAIAATIATDRVDIAANGSSAVTGPVDEFDRPPDNPLVAVFIDFKVGDYLQTITIYDPLPDTTGLSALSTA